MLILLLLFISIILLSIGLFLFYYYRDENNEKGDDDNEDGDDGDDGENEDGDDEDGDDGDDGDGDDGIYKHQWFGDLGIRSSDDEKQCRCRRIPYNINNTNDCKTFCLNNSDCVAWEHIDVKNEPDGSCLIITNCENKICTKDILHKYRKCIIPSTLNNCSTDYNNYKDGVYQYSACGYK